MPCQTLYGTQTSSMTVHTQLNHVQHITVVLNSLEHSKGSNEAKIMYNKVITKQCCVCLPATLVPAIHPVGV